MYELDESVARFKKTHPVAPKNLEKAILDHIVHQVSWELEKHYLPRGQVCLVHFRFDEKPFQLGRLCYGHRLWGQIYLQVG